MYDEKQSSRKVSPSDASSKKTIESDTNKRSVSSDELFFKPIILKRYADEKIDIGLRYNNYILK